MVDLAFLISYAVPLALVFLFDDLTVMSLFIAIGVGHVAIAFFYTYKSKKSPLWYKIAIPLIAALCYGLGWFVFDSWSLSLWYILGSFLLFCAHYYWDEMHLVYDQFATPLWSGMLSIMGAMACFYVASYKSVVYFPAYLEGVLFVVTTVTFFIFLGHIYTNSHLYKGHIVLFTSASVLIPLFLYAAKLAVSFLYVAGVVIIFHYIRWYIFYYVKTRPHPAFFQSYRTIFLGFNASVAVLFILYTYMPEQLLLQGLFHPIYFYALANTHVIASFLKP